MIFTKKKIMKEEYHNIYDKLSSEIDRTADHALNKLALNICSLLITMTELERDLSLDAIKDPQLKRMYLVAFENGQYEICKAIKNKLARDFADWYS
jgi:hypothetical protein